MTITADAITERKLAALPTELARARACTPLSIRDVSYALGISISQLSYYENGLCKPRADTRARLAAFYGVDEAQLFGQERR